ncbi:flagellar protein FliT [Massilia horti]|uniref:Flagellar protein FliT n=2 Tax=Massilia horti TaxID=2562153 RepID=A0A4Y9SWL8_9BURK|nr:flagellar protein FliT [Massilia horti]
MMTIQEVVTQYEELAGLTGLMRQAAEDGNWERLVLLEQQCAAWVRRLQDNEPQALAGAARAQKADAIRRMLDDDRRIRDLTMPWMARLSSLIQNTGNERRLARAYGAV